MLKLIYENIKITFLITIIFCITYLGFFSQVRSSAFKSTESVSKKINGNLNNVKVMPSQKEQGVKK